MNFDIDFRLLDVSLELHALEDHYDLIEKQILHLKHIENDALIEYRKKENLSPEDPEWDFSRQEFDHKTEFLLPRFFWNPFIVSLYAVFETSIIEISRLMQRTMQQGIGINDLKGTFLNRANKYYKNALDFELYNNQKDWQIITILAEIRHAIAHSNGRTDMLNETAKKKIKEYEKQSLGISFHYNYLLLDSAFARDSFNSTNSILKDLVERYKTWDTKQKNV